YGTAYRTLHLMAARGLIQAVLFGDQATRIDPRTDRHDHVHCTSCGAPVGFDVPSTILARELAADRTSYEKHGHQTATTGICPDCQRSRQDGRDGRDND